MTHNTQTAIRHISEDRLQSDIWVRAWTEYPEARRHMWAVPNGFYMTASDARIARATGLLPGVWDLHLFWYGHFYIFENKVGNNQLTVDRIVNGKKHFGQKEWGELMVAHGAKSYVIRSEEQFFTIFDKIIRPYGK